MHKNNNTVSFSCKAQNVKRHGEIAANMPTNRALLSVVYVLQIEYINTDVTEDSTDCQIRGTHHPVPNIFIQRAEKKGYPEYGPDPRYISL